MLFCRLLIILPKCLRWQYMIEETIHCLLKTVSKPGNTTFITFLWGSAKTLSVLEGIRKNIDRCQQFFGSLKRVLLEDTDLHFCISLTSLGQYYNATLCFLVLISKSVCLGSVVWSYYFWNFYCKFWDNALPLLHMFPWWYYGKYWAMIFNCDL